jgi:hypothetical protein
MTNPTEKTLNAMGFIHGVDVATWVEDELKLLEQCTAQWGDADLWVWGLFEQDMDRAFKDVHTKDQAITEMMNLQMAGDQLDTYNTSFNQLLRRCGWNRDEQDTMQLYQRGLTTGLLKRMLDQDDCPDTLDGWQDLTIKYQGKWLEAQHELAQRDNKDIAKQKAYLMRLLNQKRGQGHIRPEDCMDVDATEVVKENREKRVCYFCKKPGHLKKDCQRRMAEEAKGRKPQTQAWQIKVVNEEKEDLHATVQDTIKNMKESEQRDLLGALVDEHF